MTPAICMKIPVSEYYLLLVKKLHRCCVGEPRSREELACLYSLEQHRVIDDVWFCLKEAWAVPYICHADGCSSGWSYQILFTGSFWYEIKVMERSTRLLRLGN